MKNLRLRSKRRMKKLKKLWIKYTKIRNKLFEYYWKWARSVGKMFSRNYRINFNDIETDVAFGLLKALENSNSGVRVGYDDTEFKRYATSAIRMSIINGIRDLKSVKVSEVEIHSFMKITVKSISHNRMKSIRDEVYNIKEYVKKLPPFEKNLIYRRYFLGEKLSVISRDIGINIPSVSIRCKEIVTKMIEETGISPVS